MENKTKLELTWIGKESRPRLEPRILLEDPEKSYHAKEQHSESDIFDNRLIFGDNLLALRSLEQEFAGKIKCIYIDPPYNTGNAFENYDDSLEHSIWLGLMRDRLEILRKLLRPDGFMCCHIDDSEGQYLKVLMDEVFGRENYLTTFYIQVRYPEKTLKQDMAFHKEIEQIHIYRREYGAAPNQNASTASFEKFRFYIHEKAPGRYLKLGGKKTLVFRPSEYEIVEAEGSEDGLKEIWATGTILDGNSSGRFFRDHIVGRATIDGLGALYKVSGIGDDKFDYRYFTGPRQARASKGKYFQGVPVGQLENPDVQTTSPIENFYDLAASFGNCRHEGGVEFRSGKKPEKMLAILLKHFSDRGDWVLDSFAGSGTTGAVAHKMRRKWVMIELREHCNTHIAPRMVSVINGTDATGITGTADWKGGGGFRYYRLAPSMIEKDEHENYIISRQYNAPMLAEAMCKQMGFKFSPSDSVYWQQGRSSETDFIYVTTQTFSRQQLAALSAEVGDHRSLMICCSALRSKTSNLPNLTLVKIPNAVLARCEWGKDDYSLNVANLPMMKEQSEEEGEKDRQTASPPRNEKRKGKPKPQLALFAGQGK